MIYDLSRWTLGKVFGTILRQIDLIHLFEVDLSMQNSDNRS